jgi:uncharacterized protein
VIILDANLLIYAYNKDSVLYRQAKVWLDSQVSGVEQVGIPWISIVAFIRISTNARAFKTPFSIIEVNAIIEDLLSQENVIVPSVTDRHWEIFSTLLKEGQCSGGIVTDAHLAAIAIENGAILCTNDRDFSRFKNLKVEYPFIAV